MILNVQIIVLFIIWNMFLTYDFYSTIILWKFPALLACVWGERSWRHIKMGFFCLHSLCLCSTTHNFIILPPIENTYIYIYIYIYIHTYIHTYARTKYSYTKVSKLCWYWAWQIEENKTLKHFADIFINEGAVNEGAFFHASFFICLFHVWFFR